MRNRTDCGVGAGVVLHILEARADSERGESTGGRDPSLRGQLLRWSRGWTRIIAGGCGKLLDMRLGSGGGLVDTWAHGCWDEPQAVAGAAGTRLSGETSVREAAAGRLLSECLVHSCEKTCVKFLRREPLPPWREDQYAACPLPDALRPFHTQHAGERTLASCEPMAASKVHHPQHAIGSRRKTVATTTRNPKGNCHQTFQQSVMLSYLLLQQPRFHEVSLQNGDALTHC